MKVAVAVAKMVSRGVVPLGNLEVSVCGKVGLFVLRENWGFDDAPDPSKCTGKAF